MTTATPTRPLFGPYPIAALDDDAAPPNTILDLSDAEASDSGSKVELNFEMPRQRWMPIDSGGESTLLPVRFIDGSIVSRLAGSLTVAGRQ
ncbi:MAG: hypothetical protein AB7U18_19490, partial [Dehalococcoidia bacterium]